MRAVVLERFGGLDALAVREHPEPPLPEDGYLVEVRAIGMNFAETVERRGLYRKHQPLPYPLGKEAAGVVRRAGPRAREFRPGDPVIVVKFDNGCYADLVAARSDQVLPPPPGYSFEEMAAFATNFGTAWFAMHEVARVRPGESALIQAAAGGVGSAALALAKSFGCAPVIGTAGGAEKCAFARACGADLCVDYAREDFRTAVRAHARDGGIDYCLESVGGETYLRSLEVLAPLGRLVIIGFSGIRDNYADAIPRLHPLGVFLRSIAVCGLNLDQLQFQRRRDVWSRLLAHVREHGLRPRIGARFPLEQVAAAQAALEDRRTTGKVLLLP